MFKGCQAWFSHSVQPGPRQLWVWRRGVCGDVSVCRGTLGFPFVLTPLFLLQWLAEGCSPAGRMLIISSAVMPLTPIPAAWVNSSTAKQQPVALGHFVLPPACLQEGYTSARDMRKYIGELHDFIPGTAGYTAYWVRNEISLRPDVKTNQILSNRQLFSAKP
ncbi:hypothetical protein CIB84_013286 [Bambusicola thoracicus]|uniref:Uncharacterized protein n=1 Tax=Bambusicola thoracicus TaxID=9083 RepID=A0A2P4SFW1_BAMTH|nr:hypothetical protein CIB84_013286 [Bambusicola thoracicus]